jgi:urease accessory protein
VNAPFPAPLAHPIPPGDAVSGRAVRAGLRFAHAAGRTVLREQYVPYPLHITRPFQLDRARPDLATLYLQSASGGLYRGDDIHLDLAVEAGAGVHLTTQAATLVHDTESRPARQAVHVRVEQGSFAAVTTDPLVLLPGADIAATTEAVVHPEGALILGDGFGLHDPLGVGRLFRRIRLETRISRPDGSLLLLDRGVIEPDDLGPQGALGGFRAAGTLLIVAGLPERDSLCARMEEAATVAGCLAGGTAMPNGAGLAVRLLATNGGALARGLDALFEIAAEAVLGFRPARRRK